VLATVTTSTMTENNKKVWRSAKVKCDLCNYEWFAVYHKDCDKLECKNCTNMSYFEEVEIV
jgi:hypothetical protein